MTGTAARVSVSCISSRPNLSWNTGTWEMIAANERPCTAKPADAATRARRSRAVTAK
jgi:hypothetical protein